jgi:hypothetical protein
MKLVISTLDISWVISRYPQLFYIYNILNYSLKKKFDRGKLPVRILTINGSKSFNAPSRIASLMLFVKYYKNNLDALILTSIS